MTRPAALLLALLCLGPSAAAQPPDLGARSKAAAAAMKAERYDEAARIYREMLNAVPNEPGLLMNLGIALAMAGRETEAIEPLERAVARDPSLMPAHLFLGTSYLARGEVLKAIPPLERVVKAQPGDTDTRQTLAQAYLAADRPADAVAQLRRVAELRPKDPGAWYALGHAYNALTQGAMAAFDDEPTDSAWRQLLVADALHADGRYTDAFALYRQALAQLPAMLSIHDSIAQIYEQTGHPEWAARERAKGTLPAADCSARPALCAFRAGRHRDALEAALRGSGREADYWRVRAANELALVAFAQLEKLPDSRERREVRATLARAQRRYLDSIAELRAALEFTPDDPGLLDDLGTSYYFARDYEAAVKVLTPVLKAEPDDPRLLTVYGDSLLQLQQLDEAIAALQRAVDVDPGYGMARAALARAQVQKGNFAPAVRLLEPMLGEDTDGSLHLQLARAYAGLGQQEKATALMERSQEIQRAAQERADEIARRTISPPE